jgi:two-component system phosphate regulon sensor histidine kinase PhoR
MKQNIRLRLLSYGVIAYMMLAFAWWSVLLFIKNRDAFYAKGDLLRIGMVAEGLITNDEEFRQQEAYQNLLRRYKSQEWMILGEAGVFMISLIIGVWLINRGYHKEMIAARQRRNFLLSITHELKSPISSIQLVLETFLKRDLKKEQAEKLVQNALKETERLNTLVNDLLLSAKLEATYQPNREAIDLEELLDELIQKLESKYPEAVFRFVPSGHVSTFTGDKLGITSVGLNLLENAVKYSPRPAHIEVRLHQENGYIHLDVADQGFGIDDKEKSRIFDKFYRVGSEDTRKTKGTGLGLYIVYQIVRAHHGTITVKDNEPQGTVFHIELPME